MRLPRKPHVPLLLLVAVGLVAVACGGSKGSALNPENPSPTTTTAGGGGGATVDAGEVLGDALGDLEGAHGYRITTTSAQQLRSGALGIDQVTELDPARPSSVVEIAPDGSTRTFVDLGVVLGALFSADPNAAAAIDQASLEMWQIGDEFIIDSRKYQALVDLNPTAQLGPFVPGIGTVDLSRLGELGSEDLVQALVGTNTVDPANLAKELAGSLTDVRKHPIEADTYTARASYATVIQAMGTDVEIATRSAAAGIAASLNLSVDDVAGFYQRFYETTPADVTFALDEDGSLRSILVRSDLSQIYDRLFSEDSGVDLGATEAELSDTRRAFADTEFFIESFTTFEVDDSLVVTAPEGDFEDRTELALELMANVVPDK